MGKGLHGGNGREAFRSFFALFYVSIVHHICEPKSGDEKCIVLQIYEKV